MNLFWEYELKVVMMRVNVMKDYFPCGITVSSLTVNVFQIIR